MDPLAQAVLIWDQERLAPACEHSAAVKAGVEAYLGRAVFGAEPSLVIRVRISRAPSGDAAVATVSQEDESGRQWGERSVTAASCEELDEPLTLVVALMVDASSTSAVTPESQPPVTEPEPPPAPPELPVTTLSPSNEPIETVPSLERQTAQPGHWAVFASALASMGLLPDAGFGVGLDARLKPAGFWGVSLDAAWLLPQRLPLGNGSLELQFARAGIGLCPLEGSDEALWWSACGALGLGRLRAHSRGLEGARSKTELLALPGFSVTVGWLPRGWLALAAGLQGSFPVASDRYSYRDVLGTPHFAFQMSSFALTAQLGVGLLVR